MVHPRFFAFSRVWTVWVLLGNLIDAAPEVSLQGLRSSRLFSSLTECCPWGKPRRNPARWEIGLLWACSCVRGCWEHLMNTWSRKPGLVVVVSGACVGVMKKEVEWVMVRWRSWR
jgi:hypothetical protein